MSRSKSSKKTKFVCNNCGYESPKWLGKCPNCGAWNSFVEVKNGGEDRRGWLAKKEKSKPAQLGKILTTGRERFETGIGEVDRVLGGGIVPGSLVLIGGDPGIGKSTLLLQIAGQLSKINKKILYITAEESLEQLADRARRLKISGENIFVLAESDMLEIADRIEEIEPDVIFVDSIQTVYHPELTTAPGSVSQVRECTAEFMRIAKSRNIATLIVGHVTKDGSLAGPKTLEHMVDTVIYLEGERHMGLRILRSVKNRYGSTNEIGIFEMDEKGLVEVVNPSSHFIDSTDENRIGVAVISLLEGMRPLLVEVQALVAPSTFSIPQRNTTGFDPRRLSMILAVLEIITGYSLRNSDIFVNITGGLKIAESGGDLGVAMAIVSSFRRVPLPPRTIFIGEIGLGGEIRPIRGLQKRLGEAERLGFITAYVPDTSEKVAVDNLKVVKVKNIEEAIQSCVG